MSFRLGCCKGTWPHSVPTERGDKCLDWCYAMNLGGWLLYKVHSMLCTAPATEILKSIWTDLDLKPFYYLDTPSNEPVACLSQLWWWVESFFPPLKKKDAWEAWGPLSRGAWPTRSSGWNWLNLNILNRRWRDHPYSLKCIHCRAGPKLKDA